MYRKATGRCAECGARVQVSDTSLLSTASVLTCDMDDDASDLTRHGVRSVAQEVNR